MKMLAAAIAFSVLIVSLQAASLPEQQSKLQDDELVYNPQQVLLTLY